MIIGCCGKARSGKDTFAEMLAEALFDKLQMKFVMMAFATELKMRVQRDFDLSYEQLWGEKKEVEDRRYHKADDSFWTSREILQDYGQFFRTIDPEFWVNNLFRVISEKEYDNVIITDVRHPNEADAVKRNGGYVIKITRANKDAIHGAQHISETAMDEYEADFIVINDWGLEELRVATNDVAELLIETEILKKNLEG